MDPGGTRRNWRKLVQAVTSRCEFLERVSARGREATGDHFQDVAHCVQVGNFVVVDLDVELVFDLHQDLESSWGVDAQISDQLGGFVNLGSGDAGLVRENGEDGQGRSRKHRISRLDRRTRRFDHPRSEQRFAR